MKKRRLHIIPLAFLALLLLPLLSILFFQGVEWYLKSSAEERMKEHKTETITLQVASIHWEKLGKELVIDGKMFDVASYSISNDILTAIGYFDLEETDIRHFFSSLQKDNRGTPLRQALFMLQCFAACIVLFYTLKTYRAILAHRTIFSFLLPYPSYLVLVPPPQC